MGKSLDQLALKEEVLPAQALEALPDFGQFAQPPQPGPYRFKLPMIEGQPIWDDPFMVQGVGERIRMIFDREHPLLIVTSPAGKYNGDTFQTRISNAERMRGGKDGVSASDMDYLIRAMGETTRPASNQEYIKTVGKFGGKEFGADISFSWSCNPERDVRVDEGGDKLVVKEGRRGCGNKYYQAERAKKPEQKIEKVNGEYPLEIECACGAVLRAFANLENLRP